MYRVFCESYNNYISQYNNIVQKEEYRFKITEPLELIIHPERYKKEKKSHSNIYKRLSDLLYYIENNLNRYPKLKAFLWTLESRNMKGEYFGAASTEELEEQAKILCMFLNLLYWS